MKITGCFKAGNGHSASPRGFPAFQHPVIFIRELENPPFTEKIRFLTPFLENYTNKILILWYFYQYHWGIQHLANDHLQLDM